MLPSAPQTQYKLCKTMPSDWYCTTAMQRRLSIVLSGRSLKTIFVAKRKLIVQFSKDGIGWHGFVAIAVRWSLHHPVFGWCNALGHLSYQPSVLHNGHYQQKADTGRSVSLHMSDAEHAKCWASKSRHVERAPKGSATIRPHTLSLLTT